MAALRENLTACRRWQQASSVESPPRIIETSKSQTQVTPKCSLLPAAATDYVTLGCPKRSHRGAQEPSAVFFQWTALIHKPHMCIMRGRQTAGVACQKHYDRNFLPQYLFAAPRQCRRKFGRCY